jgi:hypothetical protein
MREDLMNQDAEQSETTWSLRDQEEPDHESATLSVLEPERRPTGRTVCERCPHAVWHVTSNEVRAYCRVMYLVSWSTKEPNEIKLCDGIFLT